MEPGEAVLFETEDAQAGRVKTHADALRFVLPGSEANPVTGPVYVRGTSRGDTLAAWLVDIRLAPRVLGDEVAAPAANLIPIRGGLAAAAVPGQHGQVPIKHGGGCCVRFEGTMRATR
jgi:acetamidase/formamidase